MTVSSVFRISGAFGLAFVLSACGYQDAPKPIEYKPGVYQGQPDDKLSKEQIKTLKERGNVAY